MQVAIAAASRAMGDFVWMSWEQHEKDGMRPSYGNLAQVYTVPFARSLREYLREKKPADQHWDEFLLQYLRSKDCTSRTSFCKPSLGGYYSYASGCEPCLSYKERQCDWTASWRTQLTAALTRVELESFKYSSFCCSRRHVFCCYGRRVCSCHRRYVYKQGKRKRE